MNMTCENDAVTSKTHTHTILLQSAAGFDFKHYEVAVCSDTFFKAQRIAVFDWFSKEFDFYGIAAMSCSL